MNVNLACGGVYVTDADWFNLDYASSSPAVQRANLLGRLPLEDAAAELVYLCFPTRSFSSPQQSELLNGGAASQGHMTPAAVIDRQIAGQPAAPLG